MKKKRTTASKTVKQASLSSHNENEDINEHGAEEREQCIKLPQEPSEGQNTSSSLATGGGRGTIPSIRVTSQDGEAQATPTTSESPNQSNGLNQSQSNGRETIPSRSQLSQSNGSSQLNGSNRQVISVKSGSNTGVVAATHGHLFTEEEVQSLQRQIADLQVDLEQLLQYTHVS